MKIDSPGVIRREDVGTLQPVEFDGKSASEMQRILPQLAKHSEATDFREGAFGTYQPWLGYLFLLESSEKSKSPVAVKEPHFKVFPEFVKVSYARRYEIFCKKLVLERKYNPTCFLMSSADLKGSNPNYVEPSSDLAARQFGDSLLKAAG